MQFKGTSLLLTCSLLLSACGSGGGGSSDSATERPSGEAKGIAQHGPVRNANISAYDWSTGTKGRFINSTQSDDVGEYSLSIQHADAPILISSNGGDYTEEANSRSVSMGNDELMAIQFYESGNTVDAQLTFFTTVSACLAAKLVSDGVTVGNAINEANSKLSAIVGVDIMNTKPIDPTLDASFTAFMTPGHSYGLAVAGISQAVETLRVLNGVTDTSNPIYTSKYFTKLACQDIAEDKLLNGLAAPTAGNVSGQLYMGSVPITTETYRRGIPIGILDFSANSNNKTGLTAQGVLEIANNISISASEIFGGTEGLPVDVTGPSIVSLAAEGTLYAGTVDLGFDIQDPLSVKTISFYLDGNLFGTAQPDDQVMRIITSQFSDGEHTVKVVATDVLDNVSEESFTFVFINSGAGVSFTSPTLVNNTDYVATGTFVDNGAGVDRILVNGEEATIDAEAGTWEISIDLVSGESTVQAIIYDSLDNSNDAQQIVSVDLIDPLVKSWSMPARFTNYDGLLNQCESGEVDAETSISRPICLNAERISLNAAPISGALVNDGYIVLAIDISDPQGAGVFSDISDLTVEYTYSLNGSIVIDKEVLNRIDESSRLVYLPIVTELLGEDFYLTGHDDVHAVKFKVTDKAGNFSERLYNITLDVLTPTVEVTTEVKKESQFSTPFESRQALNLETYRVEYTYDNESTLPYLISIEPQNNHVVTQVVEGATRKNRARQVPSAAVWVMSPWEIVFGDNGVEVVFDAELGTEYGELHYWNGSQGNSTLIAPELPAVTSAFENVSTDTIAAANKEDIQWNEGCDLTGKTKATNKLHFTSGSVYHTDAATRWANYSTTNFATFNEFQDKEEYGCSGHISAHESTIHNPLYKRVSYVPEYEEGYPRNEFTDYPTEHAVSATEIQVINKNLGTAIFPIDGWYKIPPNTKVEIVAETDLPLILNETDTRVGDDTNTVPYAEEILQDKSITWNMDTDLEISRAIDPGNFDNIDNLSKTVTVEGLGVKTYSITR